MPNSLETNTYQKELQDVPTAQLILALKERVLNTNVMSNEYIENKLTNLASLIQGHHGLLCLNNNR